MRWHPAILVLLLICALSKWLLATDIQIQDPALSGLPLSDAEYDNFFKTLNSPRRVSAVCFLRSMYGCQNALIQTLDLYENHGIVPEGKVCSDLAEMPSFPDFCTLTFYRCTLKKYFVKRIQCPDEISETSSTTQNTNQKLENTESSSTLQVTSLTGALPTTTSPERLTSASNTPTAATETITTVSDTTQDLVPKDLISDPPSTNPSLDLPMSSTPVMTNSESLLELLTSLDAVIAEQSFPELFTTSLNTVEGSLSQHLLPDVLSPNRVPTLPSTSNAVTTTPVTSVSVVTESSSEPTPTEATTPSLGSVPTNPTANVASTNSPTSESPSPVVTLTATEATTPSVGSVPTNPATNVTSASSPTSESPSPVVTLTATEATTSSVGSVPTNPATNVTSASSPTSESPSTVVTLTATEATTPSVGSVPTSPATNVTSPSSPTSESPSPVVTLTTTEATTPSVGPVPTNPPTATGTSPSSSPPSPSSPTASTTSVLLTKLTIRKRSTYPFPPAGVAGWPVVPLSAVLGQYPLQSTSVVQLLLLPPGFGPRKSKPQAIAISSLLPFGAGPPNLWQKKIMAKPQMNLLTTAKWEKSLQTHSSSTAKLENLFSRLHDKRVQQLMQKMRALMDKGKGVKKQLLQATSMELLDALKNSKSKFAVPLVPKKQLPR